MYGDDGAQKYESGISFAPAEGPHSETGEADTPQSDSSQMFFIGQAADSMSAQTHCLCDKWLHADKVYPQSDVTAADKTAHKWLVFVKGAKIYLPKLLCRQRRSTWHHHISISALRNAWACALVSLCQRRPFTLSTGCVESVKLMWCGCKTAFIRAAPLSNSLTDGKLLNSAMRGPSPGRPLPRPIK